jgi:hypothetical protein
MVTFYIKLIKLIKISKMTCFYILRAVQQFQLIINKYKVPEDGEQPKHVLKQEPMYT